MRPNTKQEREVRVYRISHTVNTNDCAIGTMVCPDLLARVVCVHRGFKSAVSYVDFNLKYSNCTQHAKIKKTKM